MIDYRRITNAYLKSFSKVTERQQQAKNEEKLELQKKILDGNLSEEDLRALDPRESAKVMLNRVLPRSEQFKAALEREQEPVLSETSWFDFSLLQGNGEDPEKSVLNRIKRTRTDAGTCVMASELVNPKTDKALLEKQQDVLRALQAAPETARQLDQAMRTIAATEDERTVMWQPKSEINNKAFRREVSKSYFSFPGLRRFNLSPHALQVKKVFADMCSNYTGVILWAFVGFSFLWGIFDWYTRADLVYFAFRKFNGNRLLHLLAMLYLSVDLCIFCLVPGYPILFWMLRMFVTKRLSPFHYMITSWSFLLFFYIPGLWFLYRHIKRERGKLNFMAVHLAGFQDLLRGARKISGLVAKNPDLEAVYGEYLTQTRMVLQAKKGIVGKLRYNLERTNFKNRSYYFSHTGQLLVAYKLLKKHKNNLVDLIYEMGLLDMQLGLIKLMEEHPAGEHRNSITFGGFSDAPKDLPQLQAEGAWHPFLDAAEAVPNNAFMDVERAFLIITGPNAGGKTTYILSLGVNSILNQCFGIAYAKSFNQTLFYKIITYINVSQDLAKGLSLAEAGMEVLRIHKEILNRTQQPILAIVDEILNGVDPEIAKEYSYEILKKRSHAHPNCLTLVTTHLMNLTGLAKEDKRFHNKRVVVKMPGLHGRPFEYTYRIQDGVTDQNVVKMMLQEKGII